MTTGRRSTTTTCRRTTVVALALLASSCATGRRGGGRPSIILPAQAAAAAAVSAFSHPPHHPPPSTTTTTTTTTTTSRTSAAVLDFYASLDAMYDRSASIKCPFFRRRAADLIDDASAVGRFLLARHKSLPFVSNLLMEEEEVVVVAGGDDDGDGDDDDGRRSASSSSSSFPVPPGCKPLGRHIGRDGAGKSRHLHVSEVARRVRGDWTSGALGSSKGYYITGRLDSTLYRDDCLFTGPDPDMPVRGLRKYLGAASSLFDPRRSDAELLSLTHDEFGGASGGGGGGGGRGVIEARWRLGGVINLPWHPTVEPWTGTTRYHLDDEGLIRLHEEGWDISVWRAFACTLIPGARTWRIWGDDDRG